MVLMSITMGVRKGESPSEEDPIEDEGANVDNLYGIGRMTRSGRVFGPQNVRDVSDSLERTRVNK